MKLQAIKRFPRTACLVLAAAVVPWYAGAVLATTGSELPASPSSPLPPTPPTVSVPVLATASRLSPAAHEVLKLVNAGVPEDVVKAYVQSSSSMFNLSPDNIVDLHNAGVSGAVTTEMISHDTAYRNNAAMAAASAQTQQPAYPQTQPPTPTQYVTTTPTPDYTQDYSGLAPYGTWSYVPGYGYGWQAYPSLGYAYYPWPILGVGLWNWCPGFGWCWFPRDHFRGGFRDFDRGHGFRDFDRFHNFNRGFEANRSGTFNHAVNNNFNRFGTFNHFNTGVVNRTPTWGGSFHSFSGGSFGHSGGGTHWSGGGGGGHFSGGGGHMGGGFGGHH